MASRSPAGDERPAVPKAEIARRIAETALDELATQLESGQSHQLQAYLSAMSRFHHYSFNNIMLILSQRPEATRVAGFHTWRKLGRTVKRGEKGIAIFAPMVLKPKESEESKQGSDDERPRLRFRVVHVFDVSQTEGEPLPEPASVGGDPGEALHRLESAVRAAGIELEDSLSLGGADGASAGGKILLRQGLPPAERFSVLAHEWAHEILHQSDGENRPSKTVRETEAEAVAFVVAHSIGLETGSASADYIQLYAGDAETLAASLDRIQRTACRIIEAVSGDAEDRPQSHAEGRPRDRSRAQAHTAASVMQRRQR